jgi:hypothetical protein
MPTMAAIYLQFEVELTMRFELMTSPLPRECSTPEPREQLQKFHILVEKMERATGIEPATSTLEGLHSTN